jgi:hypothetical protein
MIRFRRMVSSRIRGIKECLKIKYINNMTREQLNKWWKEIEAFKVGKVIQFLNIDREWYDDPIPHFH